VINIFSPKPVKLYTARKSEKSYVDWYQNYEIQLTGSKVMAFFTLFAKKLALFKHFQLQYFAKSRKIKASLLKPILY
jgi:hypothetical protein